MDRTFLGIAVEPDAGHPQLVRGGETNFGITKQVAQGYGYSGKIIDLPRELAFEIYQNRYWDSLKLDQVTAISENIAEELADTGVNMGVGTAAKFLQRCLNVFNQRQAIYSDLVVDGHIGARSIDALEKYLENRKTNGEAILLRALNSLQGAKYIRLCESREKDERFVFGWFKNRVS